MNFVQPMFSIIIPVYNAQDSISKLLVSISNQTTNHYEVIIINDGSTDDSEKKIQNFITNHNLVTTWHYYYQENSGVSQARNYGLELAKGNYVLFCDADDAIDKTLVECVENKIIEDRYLDDIVFFGKKNISNGEVVSTNVLPEIKTTSTNALLFERLLVNNFLPTTWNKAVKMSFIEEVRFKNIPVGEDYGFYLDLLEKNPDISIIQKPLYFYDIGSQDSIMHSYHPERMKIFIQQKAQINKLLIMFQTQRDVITRINRENNIDTLDRIVTNVFRKKNKISYFRKYRELKIANIHFPVFYGDIKKMTGAKFLKIFLANRINLVKFTLLNILYAVK